MISLYIRRFSDRIGRHWFEGGQDGLSATGMFWYLTDKSFILTHSCTLIDPAFIASCAKHGIQSRTPSSGNHEIEKCSEKTNSNPMLSAEILKSPLMRFAADPLCTLGRAGFA